MPIAMTATMSYCGAMPADQRARSIPVDEGHRKRLGSSASVMDGSCAAPAAAPPTCPGLRPGDYETVEHAHAPARASGLDRRGRLRPRPRRPRAQPERRRRRHPARRAGRVHRRVGLGQVVAGLRHALRRGAAAVPRVGVALRPAAVPPDGRARGRRDRRPAAGRRAAAAARLADHALVRRQRHHAVEPAAHALLARRDYPPGQPMLYAESFSPNTPRGRLPARATGSAASTT